MNKDLKIFLKNHGIDNIDAFCSAMNFKITPVQQILSSADLWHACYGIETEEVVPLSKIIGCDKENLKRDTSIINNFDNFFDSRTGNGYHTRSLSMLTIPIEDVIDNLNASFDDEPIKTISVDGKYFIAGNGMHRYIALKLYYMIELYQGKSVEELDRKYNIKVINREIDVFKTITSYLSDLFVPPLEYNSNMTKQEWLKKAQERLCSFQNDLTGYNLLISNISFSIFINREPAESIIDFLNTYFPILFKDVIKKICSMGYVENVSKVEDCIMRNSYKNKDELLQIIKQNIVVDNVSLENEKIESGKKF